jgi:hypothetical protein
MTGMNRRLSVAFILIHALSAVPSGWASVSQIKPTTIEKVRKAVRRAKEMKLEDKKVPWALINYNCSYRSLLLSFWLSAGFEPVDDLLTNERVSKAARNPVIDNRILSIAAPMAMHYRILNPINGEIVSDPSAPILASWPYHFVNVVNIGGEEKILDLSVSDEPLDILTWAARIMNSRYLPFLKKAMNEDDYQETWAYWMIKGQGGQAKLPKNPLLYHLTLPMRLRDDQVPNRETILNTLSPLISAHETLRSYLKTNFDLDRLSSLKVETTPMTMNQYCKISGLHCSFDQELETLKPSCSENILR